MGMRCCFHLKSMQKKKVYAKKLQKASEKSLFSTVIFESVSELREKENKAIITWKH